MTYLEIEVFYEHTPTHNDHFPLEEDEIQDNLQMLKNHLEYVIRNDSRIVVIDADYPNHRMRLHIEANDTEQDLVRLVQNVLDQNKLDWRRL